MSIAWVDGAGMTANADSITLPSGISAGDLVLVHIQQLVPGGPYGSGAWASDGTTQPVQVGADQTFEDTNTSQYYTDQLWAITAADGDAGATWTYTATVPAYNSGCCGVWSGAAGVDALAWTASQYSSQSGGGSLTTAEVTTTADGDWWVQIAWNATAATAYPGTLRLDYQSNYLEFIADSDGSAGPAGTVVGADMWTFTSTSDTGAFTVALKPSGAPPANTQGLLLTSGII